MARTLVLLWCKRFFQVGIPMACLLLAVDYVRSGQTLSDPVGDIVWTLIAAIIAASVSTYWAYKKHCKLVFKD